MTMHTDTYAMRGNTSFPTNPPGEDWLHSALIIEEQMLFLMATP